MAKEYIERWAVLEKQIGVVVYDEGGWDANVRAVPVEDIEAIPAADVVEVVRCGECVHCMLWQRPTNKVIGDCRIRKMNCYDDQFCMVGADDFCSYGERRDNK